MGAGGVIGALAVIVMAVVGAACGGGGGDDSGNVDDVIQKATAAVRQDGMAYYAKGDDGSEVWIDAVGQRYRGRQPQGTALTTAVGEGWTETHYDPASNSVASDDRTPQNVPRINDPMILWFEPLSALAYGQEITNLGDTEADGRAVVAVESRTPVAQSGQSTGGFLVGRIEFEPDTYRVLAFERRLQPPPGQTPNQQSVAELLGLQNTRVLYTITEFVALADLTADFFDKSQVDAQIVTMEKSIAAMREAGLTPYWLGERYEAGASVLAVQEGTGGVAVDAAKAEASFHYQLVLGGGASAETVIIRLGKPGQTVFTQPTFPQYAGKLPEEQTDVTAGGRVARVYTSVLTASAIPCGSATCPETDAPLFIRLQVVLDGVAVQVETYARVDDAGTDRNTYNNEAGIIQLAEALTPAP